MKMRQKVMALKERVTCKAQNAVMGMFSRQHQGVLTTTETIVLIVVMLVIIIAFKEQILVILTNIFGKVTGFMDEI